MRLFAFFLMAIHCLAAAAYQFQDPLVQPAEMSALATTKSAFFVVAQAGQRIVAAGQRGTIVYSDTNGKAWRQAAVPVSVDLVGLSFPTAQEGWAVGHGGVVLHTSDGGATWVKQLDGKMAGELAQKYYEDLAGSASAKPPQAVLDQARRLGKEKETQPFMDVWFLNEKTGYVVGTFNRLFRTADGGAHWIPMLDKIDNPDELHFFSIRGSGKEIYISGERGQVWRWDDAKGRFVAIPTPYNGALFGVVVAPRVVLAFGMRGSLFRTADRGAHWQKVATGSAAGIVSGSIRPNGEIIIASQAGEILVSSDDGATFGPLAVSSRTPTTSVVAIPEGGLVLAGLGGMRAEVSSKDAKR